MVMKKSLTVFLAGFILCLVPLMIPSCTHDPVGIELLDTVCFAPTVMGIIQSSCGSNGTMGCHNGSMEGWRIDDTASIMAMVKPGDPRGSKLYQVITDINGENFMPPDHPISKEFRTLIEVWIAQGATQKKCGPAPVDTGGGGGTLKVCNDSVYFQQNLLPLITTKCASCHNGTPQGGEDELISLVNYQEIRSNVNLTTPESSRIYSVLNQSAEDPMPPRDPLTSSEKSTILNWIREGAKNNSCSSGSCDTSGTITYTARVDPIIQLYCVGCHSTPTALNYNVDLSSPAKVRSVAQTLRPNNANGTSLLVGVINGMTGFKPMPKGITLDQCSIRTIELWIKQGLQ
jgi:hypothetical protein